MEVMGGASTLQACQEGKAASDVRSMSVNPGSVDDQLSSQGSWGEAVSSEGAVKKKGEGSGEEGPSVGGGGAEGGQEEEVSAVKETEKTSNLNEPKRSVSLLVYVCLVCQCIWMMCHRFWVGQNG